MKCLLPAAFAIVLALSACSLPDFPAVGLPTSEQLIASSIPLPDDFISAHNTGSLLFCPSDGNGDQLIPLDQPLKLTISIY